MGVEGARTSLCPVPTTWDLMGKLVVGQALCTSYLVIVIILQENLTSGELPSTQSCTGSFTSSKKPAGEMALSS